MGTRRVITSRNGAFYALALVVVLIAFLLLGGWTWIQGLGSMDIDNWNWAQILISMGIGFILGILATRRR